MNKPKKSLRVREITAWHSAGFSPHAGPHVRTHQCEHSLFIHVWTFGAGPQCGTRSADPHAPVWMHLYSIFTETEMQGVWKSPASSTPRWSQNFEMNEWMKKTFWAWNFALKPKKIFRCPAEMLPFWQNVDKIFCHSPQLKLSRSDPEGYG